MLMTVQYFILFLCSGCIVCSLQTLIWTTVTAADGKRSRGALGSACYMFGCMNAHRTRTQTKKVKRNEVSAGVRFNDWACLRTCTSSRRRGSPLNSGKFLRMSTVWIFSTNRSVLLRKRMMETLRKSLLLTMVSKIFMLSTRRFVLRSSIKTWSHTQTHTHTHAHTVILCVFRFYLCAN